MPGDSSAGLMLFSESIGLIGFSFDRSTVVTFISGWKKQQVKSAGIEACKARIFRRKELQLADGVLFYEADKTGVLIAKVEVEYSTGSTVVERNRSLSIQANFALGPHLV